MLVVARGPIIKVWSRYFWESTSQGVGGHGGFLTGHLEGGVIFDIKDQVCRWLVRYPESLIKIRHDLVEK